MREKKVWGYTETLHLDQHLLLAKVEIDKGGYCSIHYHQDRHNRFVVIDGTLEVKWFADDDPTRYCGSHVLTPGGECVILARTWHQFVALTPVLAYEIYYPRVGSKVRHEDIVRFTEGGMLEF